MVKRNPSATGRFVDDAAAPPWRRRRHDDGTTHGEDDGTQHGEDNDGTQNLTIVQRLSAEANEPADGGSKGSI